MRWLLCLVVIFAVASPAVTGGAHPHDEDSIVMMSGTLTKVDLAKRTIELDTIDRQTRRPRNVLLFVDAKLKLKQGKLKLTFEDLAVGQRVTCIAEIERDQDSRLVAFEIWVNDRPAAK